MSWKGIVNVTFPSHLQTLMALFPKSKVLKGLVSGSELESCYETNVLVLGWMHYHMAALLVELLFLHSRYADHHAVNIHNDISPC